MRNITEKSRIPSVNSPFPQFRRQPAEFGCAAYESTPPLNAANFLELAKNCKFLERNKSEIKRMVLDLPEGQRE